MIVSLKHDADPTAVMGELISRGLWVTQVERSASGAALHYVIAPHSAEVAFEELSRIDGISAVSTSKSSHPLVDRMGPSVAVGDVRVGAGDEPAWMCGPCSVESEEHVRESAAGLAALGVTFLRGGAFKPRSSPYSFQGVGIDGLKWLRRAADAHRMKVVTEALGEADVSPVVEHADLVQVGSRNMQNFALLSAIGRARKPVLLKRGMAATVDEWLLAGEYLLLNGATGVIFCERGIRSFDDATRNLLDLAAVALLAHVHRLPVVVDPSHGAGRRDLVAPLGRAALAAGAAGLMIETHEAPARALSDGPQALRLAELASMIGELTGAGRRGAARGAGSSAEAEGRAPLHVDGGRGVEVRSAREQATLGGVR
jgi:3-deoxy-7-phosphoheptulonate synthase